MSEYLDSLIHRVDLDELVRYVDNTCAARDFEHLIDIRDRSRAAVNTGRQLWPIATLANYRLALYAPAHLAVRSLDDNARTFMPGPLSEILSVHHSWGELSEHLPQGPDRSLVAYERALRGDIIATDETDALDIPVAPCEWEPSYPIATYDDDGVHCDPPTLPDDDYAFTSQSQQAHDGNEIDDCEIDDDDTVTAVRELFSSWTTESNGSVSVTVVDGSIRDALIVHGLSDAQTAPIATSTALAWLAWAGASGGAHGTRRGMATGRFGAWWLCATIADIVDDWPLTDAASQNVMTHLQWERYSHPTRDTNGWVVHLAVHDPSTGVSICIDAADSAD